MHIVTYSSNPLNSLSLFMIVNIPKYFRNSDVKKAIIATHKFYIMPSEVYLNIYYIIISSEEKPRARPVFLSIITVQYLIVIIKGVKAQGHRSAPTP